MALAAASFVTLLAAIPEIFVPDTALGWVDAWYYVGFAQRLPESLRQYSTSLYQAERLSWILPGYLLNQVAPPLAANYLLKGAYFAATVCVLFGALRQTCELRTAAFVSALASLYSFVAHSLGANYVDGAANLYFLIAVYAASRARPSKGRPREPCHPERLHRRRRVRGRAPDPARLCPRPAAFRRLRLTGMGPVGIAPEASSRGRSDELPDRRAHGLPSCRRDLCLLGNPWSAAAAVARHVAQLRAECARRATESQMASPRVLAAPAFSRGRLDPADGRRLVPPGMGCGPAAATGLLVVPFGVRPVDLHVSS